MKPVLVILKINGGELHYPFKVYAKTDYAAGLTAKIHLQSKLGLEVL